MRAKCVNGTAARHPIRCPDSLVGAGPTSAAPRAIHVFVALADNDHQGMVPVPARSATEMMRITISIGVRLTAYARFSVESRIGSSYAAE